MGIEFVQDEADKRRGNPLPVPERKGFVRRWVRTKGWNQESHMADRKAQGYVPVRREAEAPSVGRDARMQTTQGADQDTTITRGDLMLMECPEERVQKRRAATRVLTESRTKGVEERMKANIAEIQRARKGE